MDVSEGRNFFSRLCPFVHGGRLDGIAGGIVGVIGGESDRLVHVGHRDAVAKKVLHDAALAALGLDANAVFSVRERAVFHRHIAHAAGRLAADGHAVAVQKNTVAHRDVFTLKLAAGNGPAGLDGDVVVAHVNVASGDQHPPAARINRVGVRRALRRENGHIGNDHVLAIRRDKMKLRRVLQRDVFQPQIFGLFNHNQIWPGQSVAGFDLPRLFRLTPPDGTIAVNHAAAGDRHVRQVFPADERNELAAAPGLKPVAGLFHKIHLVRARLQCGSRLQFHRRFGMQRQRPAQISSRREKHRAAGIRAAIQRLLNRCRVKSQPIAFGAKVAHVE